ncbi:MAG: AsmA-like C-terminal domain-containing protein [Proteobacteria bacterium]|nr:AsmA-like C-terminal domain-containing protein [Pseudomonadota bacterium]MBU4472271.1 AsmA-like C-terminal domain-containing protein [Pseudomonadota bacterium]MCG2751966.1 AsmA-like C-terminal domain-containing protein [Desulfobacteraceae bacterium]
MSRKKIIFIILSTGILLAGILFFFTHSLVRIKLEETIRFQLETRFDDQNGNLQFKSLRINLFPSPHLVVKNIVFNFPQKAEGSIKRLEAYPNFRSLVIGKLEVSDIEIESPDIKVFTPAQSTPPVPGGVSALRPAVEKAFVFFRKYMPGLTLKLNKGKVAMISGESPPLDIYDIHSVFNPSSSPIFLSLSCGSNLWEHAALDFILHDKTFKGSGKVSIQKLQVEKIPEALLPKANQWISHVNSDIDIHFTTQGLAEIKGTTEGNAALILHPEKQKPLPIHCSEFSGSFFLSETITTLKMERLTLSEPGAKLSGEYRWDKKAPLALLEVTGTDVDVPSVRKTSLALFGRFKTTRTIFDYVREGHISSVTFSGRAPTFKEFKNPGSIKLESHLDHGRAFIPNAELDLQDVFGDVSVLEGVLIGENLRARFGNTTGKDGRFKIGLHGAEAPMDLMVSVDADLSQLPPVLLRLIKGSGFQREMSQVKDCKGHGTGKLFLGGKVHAVKPRVEVDGFSLSARYLRTPLATTITGKKLLYDNNRIEVHQAQGTWGSSKFKDFSAVFDWRKTPALVWKFENASLVSDEIYPWLTSLKGFADSFQMINSLKGGMDLAKTRIEGPLFSPAHWSFTTSGATQELNVIDESLFPSEVIIKGDFNATNQTLSFSNAFFNFSDTALAGSGRLLLPPGRMKTGNVLVKGFIGPESFPWFLNKIALPFKMQKGISVTLSDVSSSWNPEGRNDFSGSLAFKDGPLISLAGMKDNNHIEMNALAINDGLSNASIAFKRDAGILNMDFKGQLALVSLEKLIESQELVSGSMNGDFHAAILMDHMEKSTLEGFLEAKNLSFGEMMNLPLTFDTFSLKSENKKYTVTADCTFQKDTPLHVDGKIYPLSSEMGFDLNIASDHLNVDQFISYFKKRKKQNNPEKSGQIYHAPIKGSIRTECKQVVFNQYQWSDVKADLMVSPESVVVNILEGDLCGIQTPGQLLIGAEDLRMGFNPSSENHKFEDTLPCLGSKKDLVQGDFVLNGEVIAGADFQSLWQSTQGNFSLHAQNGRIYKFNLLAKVFALLNITEIFRGNLPDIAREGFRYNSIDMEGTIEGSKIILQKAFIDGASMGIVMKGEIDPKNDRMDITLLVAPLKTMDYILEKIPLVNRLIKGALVSIPVQIKGSMKDPEVSTLSPASVDTGLVGFMKNTLKLPITIIEPFLSPEKEKEKPDESGDHKN